MFLGPVLALALAAQPVGEKPVIRSHADLPPTEFKVGPLPSEAFMSDAFLRETVPAVRLEAERLLREYRIEDPAISQRLRTGLAAIALLQARPRDAERLIAEQRASETKPQLRQVGYMLADAMAAGLRPGGSRDCAASAARITALLEAAPAEVAREEVLFRYGRVQVSSPVYYQGTAVGAVDPYTRPNAGMGTFDILLLAIWRAESEGVPACREPLTRAFRAWLDAPETQPTDIWVARQPKAGALTGARPVTVAVWDTGIDLGLFGDRLAIDPAEPLDGKDNDGNGVVDDVHGPTFDGRFLPSAAPLPLPSPALAPRLGFQMAIEKGQLDINYGFDTPEARMFAERARTASAAEQGVDVSFSEEMFNRSHGTWVASALLDGADWIRLYNLRQILLAPTVGAPPTMVEETDRWVAALPALAARLRGSGVRVVNMSWSVNADALARDLMTSGIERDPEKAYERGKALYLKIAAAFQALVDDCPGILFIAAAGNSNQSDDIMAGMPQGVKAPNFLAVGATNSAGRASTFTTFGPSVRIYAQGERTPTRGPGGMTLLMDGTSLAAPLVSRAAAGMLAINPDLKPADVIDGLIATSTEGEGGLKLLHAADAIDWAQERR